MTTSHDRLKEERLRIGLSQVAFGAIGGVGKHAQINYEKGARHPDSAYLEAIAAAGADVLYILTGQRSPPVHPTSHDQAILMLYNSLKPEAQEEIYKSLKEKELLSRLMAERKKQGNE